ncbi:MAG: hypothetical protein ACT4O2_02400 [Beijerinckiaceae bacterium]
MRLLVKWVDLRGGYTTPVAFRTPVVDEDTGKEVGFVQLKGLRAGDTFRSSRENFRLISSLKSSVRHSPKPSKLCCTT